MGKFVKAYDPKESRDWKTSVSQFALAAGVKPITGPVLLSVVAFLPRPKRLCRKSDLPSPVPAECKPDADNLYKLVADALIGIAYADDSSVVDCTCRKFYHAIGGMPSTWVMVGAAGILAPSAEAQQGQH